MAKTSTTLAGNIGPGDTVVSSANNAALRPGDNIVIANESMRALVVDPAVGAIVYRGNRGTAAAAASSGATLTYGPPTDWGPLAGSGGVGVTSVPLQFEPEAAAEIAAEDAKELGERVETKRKELEKKAAEKAAADAKAAEKAAAEAKAAADKNEKPAPAHK